MSETITTTITTTEQADQVQTLTSSDYYAVEIFEFSINIKTLNRSLEYNLPNSSLPDSSLLNIGVYSRKETDKYGNDFLIKHLFSKGTEPVNHPIIGNGKRPKLKYKHPNNISSKYKYQFSGFLNMTDIRQLAPILHSKSGNEFIILTVYYIPEKDKGIITITDPKLENEKIPIRVGNIKKIWSDEPKSFKAVDINFTDDIFANL